jgi:pimeloyl-ACP methyl ester carboxylesterase
MSQELRFLTARDGVRIAYVAHGAGAPLLFVRGWISHLELLWEDAAFRSFIEAFARHHLVIRYDMRGNGLSQRQVGKVDLDALLLDVESLADQLNFEKFVLYGASFGGPLAIRYAARHPERVHKLILDGTYARGKLITTRTRQIMLTKALRFFPEMAFLLLAHVSNPDSRGVSYRRPEVARQMISPAYAARLYHLAFHTDVSDDAARLKTPTLIIHRRESQAIPFHLGVELASLVPEARFVALSGQAHNAWDGDVSAVMHELSDFLGVELTVSSTLSPVRVAPDQPRSASTTVGSRYRLGKEIGVGGMGVVHRARDLRLKRDVAIKLLSPTGRLDTVSRRRFEREIGLTAALRHPNICAIYDMGDLDDRPFLVMELLDGETLARVMSRGRLSLATTIEVTRQVAAALEAAHQQNIVHRDVKPANIFLTVHGQVKILDFGLAKALEPLGSGYLDSVSQSGVVVGTVAYMSPEQARGETVDPRADIFSLGAVLLEMLTGVPAFRRDSTASTLEAILHHDPLPALRLEAGLPDALVKLLQKLLEKNRDSRTASAGELIVELDQLRSAIGAVPNEPWPVRPGGSI